MKDKVWLLSIRLKNFLAREDGQDLIEYALLIAFVAFAVTAGMTSLAGSINTAFSTIGTALINKLSSQGVS